MRATFMGLEMGKRSIMAQQTALDVTGHNLSNANTVGYTRQEANLVTTRPYHTPMLTGNSKVGQLGTGVDVADIRRLRDDFVDGQIRNENKTAGYWDSLENSLAKIEVILNEPSDNGLRGVMDAFWMSWQDLSAHPESEAVRSVVAQRGMALADAINHTDRQLTELKEDLNATVKVKVDEINSIALQLKDLNQQILSIKIAGKQPNDLLDKRDLLIDQLSEIVDVQVSEDNRTSMVTVQLGGRNLVQDVYYNPLDVKSDTEGMHMVTWQDTGVKASISSGELRGVLDARGKTLDEASPSEYKELIPNLMEQLNILAKTIVVKTNDLHRQGYSLNNHKTYPDGKDFFNMPDPNIENWAEFMQVSDAIVNDVKNIAAATEPTWENGTKVNFGDGSNALKIAQLKHDLNDNDDSMIQNITNDDYWRSITAEIGVKSQEAIRMAKNQKVLLSQLESKRQSVSGVALDEEITNMIKFQHAYNASSRYITTIDETLDVIINRMGIVGR
ncbi:MAG: flagellar hook-associated protein FlgK [Syntrophomonadaceae bacterium]|nr:flagellar hook-associated protein FlgK [Syntrophomonadaceae bacterium]MDD4550409.1 flagellar hook-associated protein FlgK [Syntrophomonadaceae bacterium]